MGGHGVRGLHLGDRKVGGTILGEIHMEGYGGQGVKGSGGPTWGIGSWLGDNIWRS